MYEKAGVRTNMLTWEMEATVTEQEENQKGESTWFREFMMKSIMNTLWQE